VKKNIESDSCGTQNRRYIKSHLRMQIANQIAHEIARVTSPNTGFSISSRTILQLTLF
jgi:hypothetical protein